jgi:hypothetical protein
MRFLALLSLVTLVAGVVVVAGDRAVPARDSHTPVWRWPLLVIADVDRYTRPYVHIDPATPAQVVFWRRHALDAWFSEAFEAVSGQRKDPPRSSRAYAYLAVGSYDAVVVSSRARREGSEVSSIAAIAGSASPILAELFPELPPMHFSMLANQAASARVAAGETASAVRRGLSIGRAVAELLLERARRDGYERAWEGEPTPPWERPPGARGALVEPLAGTWRTWLLSSGDALRPAPPPAVGSAELRTEAAEVLHRSRTLVPRR